MSDSPDSIATFPLRNATDEELGHALALTQRDFMLWHGQASAIAKFPSVANRAGVSSVLAYDAAEGLRFSEELGILSFDGATKSREEIAEMIVSIQLPQIEHSARVAATVMIHSAFERFLWRLIRFAIIGNRSKAIEQIEKKTLTVEQLASSNPEQLVDAILEKSWVEVDNLPMLKRWDKLVDLIGSPAKLRDVNWHFDKEMLVNFDEVRHNCVHHEGSLLREFDLAHFESQLDRSTTVWMIEIAKLLNVKIPGNVVFGLDAGQSKV
jgi:hypothetical protein